MADATNTRTEKALLAEIGLGLALVGLAVFLYWRPAADGELSPQWWHWLALGALFFGVVGIHGWRSRRRSHRGLHQAIREDAAALAEEPAAPAAVEPPPPSDTPTDARAEEGGANERVD